MSLGRGDLGRVQPGIGTGADRDDTVGSVGGHFRRVRFTAEVWGAEEPTEYAPDAQFVSEIHRVVRCPFAMVFAEPPFMSASVMLKPKDTNDPDVEDHQPQEYIEDYEPVLHACTMAWHRLEGHWGFVGADVSIRVYDHPWKYKMHVRFEFSGLALAVPYSGDTATIPTTTKV